MRGTLDEALQGVAAYNAPSSEDEDLLEKRRKAISKHRKSSKEKSRKSKSKKEKEHSKKKSSKDKHKKDKEKESSAEASDESDSDLNDINVQLERGRAAVRITREILQQQPGLKTELRQVWGPSMIPMILIAHVHNACETVFSFKVREAPPNAVFVMVAAAVES